MLKREYNVPHEDIITVKSLKIGNPKGRVIDNQKTIQQIMSDIQKYIEGGFYYGIGVYERYKIPVPTN